MTRVAIQPDFVRWARDRSGLDPGDLVGLCSLHSDIPRPFPKSATGRIAVKVINHLGDEVMKVFRV